MVGILGLTAQVWRLQVLGLKVEEVASALLQRQGLVGRLQRGLVPRNTPVGTEGPQATAELLEVVEAVAQQGRMVSGEMEEIRFTLAAVAVAVQITDL